MQMFLELFRFPSRKLRLLLRVFLLLRLCYYSLLPRLLLLLFPTTTTTSWLQFLLLLQPFDTKTPMNTKTCTFATSRSRRFGHVCW